jgi:hypothetical protein
VPGKHWTAAELATLHADYPVQGAKAVAASLNRTLKQVHNKASSRGVRRDKETRANECSARAKRIKNLRYAIGDERTESKGYVLRKVGPGRWQAAHTFLWTQHHGPVPEGYQVQFRNGNKTDIRIENLELISYAENMNRNSVHNYPSPIPELVQLRSVLQRKINQKRKAENVEPTK